MKFLSGKVRVLRKLNSLCVMEWATLNISLATSKYTNVQIDFFAGEREWEVRGKLLPNVYLYYTLSPPMGKLLRT